MTINAYKPNLIVPILVAIFLISVPTTLITIFFDWPLPTFPWGVIPFITLGAFVAIIISLPTLIKEPPNIPPKKIPYILYGLLAMLILSVIIYVVEVFFLIPLTQTSKYIFTGIVAIGGIAAVLSPIVALLFLFKPFKKSPLVTTINIALIPFLAVGLAYLAFLAIDTHNNKLQESMDQGISISLPDFLEISDPKDTYAIFVTPYSDTSDGFTCKQLQLTTKDLDSMGIIMNNWSDTITYIYTLNSDGILNIAGVKPSLIKGPPSTQCVEVSRTIMLLDKPNKRYKITELQSQGR